MGDAEPDEGVAREDYTWAMAVKDLALTTHLDLRGAVDLLYPLREGPLHPYDVLPVLSTLVNHMHEGKTGPAGAALARLLAKPAPGVDLARVRAYRVTTDRASDGHAVRADLYPPEDVEVLMLPDADGG